jgi:BlaI family penicillinase repressor
MGRRPKEAIEERKDLTPLELEIMAVVWQRGDATAAEVCQALEEYRPLADTTVHTVLANLRKKGIIKPIPTVERALRFAPLVSREQVAGRTLRQLIGKFFDGSPQRLMAHLVRECEVGEEEWRDIRDMIRQSEGKRGGP